jgi:hypothetical protein
VRAESARSEKEERGSRRIRQSTRFRRVGRLEPIEMVKKSEWIFGINISEKKVCPVIPKDPRHLEQLREDFITIGCEELQYMPRDIQDTGVLDELVGGPMTKVFWIATSGKT